MSGDLNADNRVGLNDLAIQQANLGATSATRSQGDLTGDGIVSRADVVNSRPATRLMSKERNS